MRGFRHFGDVLRQCGPLALVACAMLLTGALGARSDEAAKSGGKASAPVVLSVENADGTSGRHFTMRELERLGGASFRTSTPWTKTKAQFEGVYLKDLVAVISATGGTIKAVALNDYASLLPMEDAEKHGALVVYKVDGKFLSVRDKGPLWIVYPFDLDPSLKREVIYSRSVWQLRRLVVQP